MTDLYTFDKKQRDQEAEIAELKQAVADLHAVTRNHRKDIDAFPVESKKIAWAVCKEAVDQLLPLVDKGLSAYKWIHKRIPPEPISAKEEKQLEAQVELLPQDAVNKSPARFHEIAFIIEPVASRVVEHGLEIKKLANVVAADKEETAKALADAIDDFNTQTERVIVKTNSNIESTRTISNWQIRAAESLLDQFFNLLR